MVFFCGCMPVLIHYKHVVVKESPKLKVVERSTESNSSDGSPLSNPKIGLPIKSLLSTSDYIIEIYTPINSIPVVFLKCADAQQQELELRGANLLKLDPINDYHYSFIVDEAAGKPLDFIVITNDGRLIGHEKVVYELISRGYVWAIDAL